ncbi:carboxylesterase [Phyllosticta citriasiana]|uniref:Carboxylic ester hydrolase n=1 Tax=Phyllosticta citriasiana TaxID=595635 RepID=A0ABR1KN06_9PEZI
MKHSTACMGSIFATAVTALAGSTLASSGSAPVIYLDNGITVHAKVNQTASPEVAQYLGIPFAQPPIGSLRWEPPQPYKASGREVINSTKLPPSCWQYVSVQPGVLQTDAPQFMIGSSGMSEDCLTASVWTPTSASSKNASLPVLIWFYGGGFATGGEDVPYQVPDKWVQRTKDHIVVTFNYRINIFGFPDAAGLDEVNLGLMDQRLAVEWIRDNIAKFGGNPDNMVIWGQSAGAVAVDYYNFAYPEEPIVKGLIMDSGTVHLNQLLSPDNPGSNFSFVASNLGCGNQTSPQAEIACMRNVPAWKIEKFVAEYEDSGDSPSITFAPMIDDKLVYEDYTEKASNGELSRLPALIGFNDAEGLFLAPYSPDGPNMTVATTLAYEYFFCPTTKTTYERLSAGRTTHRYFYNGNFTNISPRPWLGAYHGSELPLLFGTHADFRGNSTPFEYELSHTLQDAWVAFARDPENGLDRLGWPAYEEKGGQVRKFSVDGVLVQMGDVSDIEAECQTRGLL